MSIFESPTSLTDKPSAPLIGSASAVSRPLYVGLFTLFLVGTSIPLLDFRVPPLSDYINHLARCYVIALDGRDTVLAQFYSIDWQLIPNLAIDLIVPPLARIVDIYTAGQIFLVSTVFLLLAGPHL